MGYFVIDLLIVKSSMIDVFTFHTSLSYLEYIPLEHDMQFLDLLLKMPNVSWSFLYSFQKKCWHSFVFLERKDFGTRLILAPCNEFQNILFLQELLESLKAVLKAIWLKCLTQTIGAMNPSWQDELLSFLFVCLFFLSLFLIIDSFLNVETYSNIGSLCLTVSQHILSNESVLWKN